MFSGCDPEEDENGEETKVPGAVENFTATAGNVQVSLTWEAPSDNGGAESAIPNITRGEYTGDELVRMAGKKDGDNNKPASAQPVDDDEALSFVSGVCDTLKQIAEAEKPARDARQRAAAGQKVTEACAQAD
jgi:hypothetical protein